MRTPYSNEMDELKKCRWSPEQDIILVSYIQEHGACNWRAISEDTGLQKSGKSGRSCRVRWKNYLRPGIKLGDYSQEEEDIIILHQARLGNRWSRIATYLPQRTDNNIKNYWYTHLKKKVELAKRDNNEVPGASGALVTANESIRITLSPENNQAVSITQQMLNVKLTEKWLLDDNPSAFPFPGFSDSGATTGGFADIGATSGNEMEDLFPRNAFNPFGGHQGS